MSLFLWVLRPSVNLLINMNLPKLYWGMINFANNCAERNFQSRLQVSFHGDRFLEILFHRKLLVKSFLSLLQHFEINTTSTILWTAFAFATWAGKFWVPLLTWPQLERLRYKYYSFFYFSSSVRLLAAEISRMKLSFDEFHWNLLMINTL